MSVHEWVIAPFAEFVFMRRALVAVLAISLGSAPIGSLLVLRRMSLMGDAMAHALLPGAAVGFIVAGFSLAAMSVGSFVAGLVVALGAGLVTRATSEREDASFAAFYLISLALGVLLVSMYGSSVDLIACAVRQHPGGRRPGAVPDGWRCQRHLADIGGHLPAAGGGVSRPGLPAPGRRARFVGAYCLPGVGGGQFWLPASRPWVP